LSKEISYLIRARFRDSVGSGHWHNTAMTYPRSHLVSTEEPGSYHVVSRCVRFARERKKRVLCAVMRVDLNPVRAAMCDTLIDSDHTSIQRRLKERESQAARARLRDSLLDRPLKPVAGLDANSLLEMTEASYIDLVQWAGEQPRADKRG
jgi:hypothetical protein